jgi:phosphoribosylpyrophosphate synthetase
MDTESDDIGMKGLREEFFCGEIGFPISRTPTKKPEVELTPQIMLNRIYGRLLSVVTRACSTSQASVKFVDAYEQFLVQCFGKEKATPLEADVSASLLEPPTVTRKKSGSTIARFYFDSISSAGGFHRLLLHAVTQFHGLNAISKTVEMETNTARLLTVTGNLSGPNVRLVDHIIDDSPTTGTSCSRVSSRDAKRQTFDVSYATKSLSTLRL